MAQVTCCVCGETESNMFENYNTLSNDEYLTGLLVCDKCSAAIVGSVRGADAKEREGHTGYLQEMLANGKVMPLARSYIKAVVEGARYSGQGKTGYISPDSDYVKEKSIFQNMIVSTTSTLEGYRIKKYCGIVASGGEYTSIVTNSINLKRLAMGRGANAIVGVSLCFQDHPTGYASTGLPWMSGTAVEIEEI